MKYLIILVLLMGIAGDATGQDSNEQPYQADWTFYFSNVDDKLGSIATDLNLTQVAPKEDQPFLVYIIIQMLNPREDGLSHSEEAQQLWDIEDHIVSTLDDHKLNYTLAGRLTSDGNRVLYFYGDSYLAMEHDISLSMTRFPKYEFEVGHQEDKGWKGYSDFLYPLPRQLQMIQNRRVVEQIESHGDDLSKAREVFHWIYFTTKNDLEAFEKFAVSEGFKVLDKVESEDFGAYKFQLSISRIDKVGYNDVDEYTLLLWEKAGKLNGEYDGWETSIEKE